MKKHKIVAGLSFAGLLATVAVASAQVNVTAPPAGAVGPTNVQAGPVDVQTTPGGGTSVHLGQGPAGAAANQMRDNAAVRQENRMERRDDRQMDRNAGAADWRMVRHNNQWWYWNPNNSWSVYRNNQWGPYSAENATFAPNTMNQPTTQYYSRRGPLGMRRQVTGYRGVTTPPANSSTMGGTPPAVPSAPNADMPTNSTNSTPPSGYQGPLKSNTGAANPQGGTNGQPNDPLIQGVK